MDPYGFGIEDREFKMCRRPFWLPQYSASLPLRLA